jgi:6-pyruvoyltetrahydropterin/6-carboxytetrahydropterin synthase
MQKVRVTKEFTFEMAHALWNYDGACRNVHGHSYKLFVTIIGTPKYDVSSSKLGMVIDFGDLKRIVKREIVDKYDHSLVISDSVPFSSSLQVEQMFHKSYIVNFQPTCENLVIDFAKRLKPLLPDAVSLFSLKLYETETSFAEWYQSDNI